MTQQSGGGLPPGVSGNGQTPGGLTVAGGVGAAVVGASDPNQISIFDGGVIAHGQGITTSADFGNVPLDAFYKDVDGNQHLGLRVDENGATWVRLHLKISSVEVHTLGAYSGSAFPVYDSSDNLIGYVPLYA